jgi:hypothetical protein
MREDSSFETEVERKLLEMISEMQRLSENIEAYIKHSESFYSAIVDMAAKGESPNTPPEDNLN